MVRKRTFEKGSMKKGRYRVTESGSGKEQQKLKATPSALLYMTVGFKTIAIRNVSNPEYLLILIHRIKITLD